jgi:hypothetical protein
MKTPALMLLLIGVLLFPCRAISQSAASPSNSSPAKVEVSRLPEISVQKSWTDAGSFWLNAALLLVGAIGVAVAGASLKTITGQLTEMQNGAKREAELNRPWLVFDEVKADGVFRNEYDGPSHGKDGPKLHFKVINRGLTPAKVKAWEFRVEAGGPSKPDNLPLQPKQVSDVPIKILPAGIDCKLEAEYPPFSNGEQMRLGSLEMVLWFYGVACYEDIYGASHETRFCYRSTGDPLLRCPTLEEAGPDEYRRIS